MSMGNYLNGAYQVKIQVVGITDDDPLSGTTPNFAQLSAVATTEDLVYDIDIDDFSNTVANEVALDSCEENPIPPDTEFDYYLATGCCENLNLQDIYVGVSNTTSITLGETFLFNSVCYTFASTTGSTVSGITSDFVFSGDVITAGCSDPRCGDCNTDFNLYELENCCDSLDTITILLSGGTAVNGDGLVYSGVCYTYQGNPGTGTPVITTDTLTDNICTKGVSAGWCTACTGPSPTPTSSLTQTPTPSVSLSLTPTQTPTPTPTITSVSCSDGSGDFLGGCTKNHMTEQLDGTFQTRLIQVLPPDLPDPGNINAPVNYDQVIINRYSQGG